MAFVNQLIKSTFKLHGFNLNTESTRILAESLSKIDEQNHEDTLEKIIDELAKKNLDGTSCLTKADIENVLKELNQNDKKSGEKVEIFHIIDAFDVPKSIYCEVTKKLIKLSNNSRSQTVNCRSLLGESRAKIDIFTQRFKIIHQRTMRHELFSPCVVSSNNIGKKKFQLKPIEYLLSNVNHVEDIIVLGMISQLKENKFFIEDQTGHLPLNLSDAKYHSGIYTEGCFVLAEGNLVDGIFEVKALGFPPAEFESTSRAYFGNINYFGGPNELSCKSSIAMSQAQLSIDSMIVFLSDVWLDSPSVFEKLQTLFVGYSDCPPYAFVMCGNFLSDLKYGLRCNELKEGFKRLADLVAQFESIKENSYFIFVPGPQDPGVVRVYPRAGILPHCTEYIRKKLAKCHFATNPCRIQFGSRQIVVFREDLLQKMSRNAIRIPDQDKLTDDLAKTLICQAHLAPLPLHVVPIYWNYDYVMRLYPLPDLVVVADKQKSFTHTFTDCTVINPGSFPFNNFAFKVYVPSTKQIEDCVIPNE